MEKVVALCDTCLEPSNEMINVRYPAATVLLDLSASENCIEKVGYLIYKRNLMEVVLREL